jgi:hypothetical protein
MKGADMIHPRCRSIALIAMMAFAITLCAQNTEDLTEEQIRDFLLHAKVIRYKEGSKGITSPYRLTLKKGSLEHEGSFQYVDEYRPTIQLNDGRTEMNFRDTYKFSIAAFELAKLLGLGDMMPVTVERRWERKIGALSWWLPAKMDEEKRRAKNIQPPDPVAWNKQWQKMVVFWQLVYDMDRNQRNMLISEDWHLWMIDFSRAFRLYTTLENPKALTTCDRKLLQKLRNLNAAELKQKTKNLLSNEEIKGLMARRDLIVDLFDKLIAGKGEAAVLYD